MREIINKAGQFEIRVSEFGVWLYWIGKPLKHLTVQEFRDLELLMRTTECDQE